MKWKLSIMLLTCLWCSAIPRSAGANSIGVGLDWRKGVFVQEYWEAGKAHYAVTNVGKTKVQVSAFKWNSGNDEAGTAAPVLGPVDIQPSGVVLLDTDTPGFKALTDNSLLSWTADGTSLGLLFSPGKDPATDNKSVATYYGLNGSGGRQTKQWVEQAATTLPAGDEVTLTLIIRPNSGVVKFPIAPKPMENALPQLALLRATCDTLTTRTEGENIVIDSSGNTDRAKPHTVKLVFKAPATVRSQTMYMISGWAQLADGGGYGITRGVVISPQLIID